MKTHSHHHRQTSWIIMVPTTHTHYFLLWSLMYSTSRFCFWVKTHYGVDKIVIALYCFSKVPCSNFDHVNIMKDFHNVFAFMVSQNPKNWNATKVTFFFMSYTFEGQFYALMVRFENTIIFYVNPTIFFRFLASLKFLVFLKLFLISCVFWNKK
jgi:hypothetical protein